MNPKDRFYTQEHEWVQLEDGVATIGLTSYARRALGDVRLIDLPAVGSKVNVNQPIGEVESSKSVTDIYAPIAGTVSAKNTELVQNPHILNNDPWEKGWLIQIVVEGEPNTAVMMDAETYTSLTEH